MVGVLEMDKEIVKGWRRGAGEGLMITGRQTGREPKEEYSRWWEQSWG